MKMKREVDCDMQIYDVVIKMEDKDMKNINSPPIWIRKLAKWAEKVLISNILKFGGYENERRTEWKRGNKRRC